MSKQASTVSASSASSDDKAKGSASVANAKVSGSNAAGASSDDGDDDEGGAAAEGLREQRFRSPKIVEGAFVVTSPIKYTSTRTKETVTAPAFTIDEKGQRQKVIVDDLSDRDADHFYEHGCIQPLMK